YTEHLTQRLGITAPVAPQTLTTTTTVNSGKVDLSVFRRALFFFETGAFGGTSPTLSAVLQIQDIPVPGRARWRDRKPAVSRSRAVPVVRTALCPWSAICRRASERRTSPPKDSDAASFARSTTPLAGSRCPSCTTCPSS